MIDRFWRRGKHYRSVAEMESPHPLFCKCERAFDLERGTFHGIPYPVLTPKRGLTILDEVHVAAQSYWQFSPTLREIGERGAN